MFLAPSNSPVKKSWPRRSSGMRNKSERRHYYGLVRGSRPGDGKNLRVHVVFYYRLKNNIFFFFMFFPLSKLLRAVVRPTGRTTAFKGTGTKVKPVSPPPHSHHHRHLQPLDIAGLSLTEKPSRARTIFNISFFFSIDNVFNLAGTVPGHGVLKNKYRRRPSVNFFRFFPGFFFFLIRLFDSRTRSVKGRDNYNDNNTARLRLLSS